MALPEDLTLILRPDARDRLDQRALARAVVADERGHLPDGNVQVDADQRAHRAEVLFHVDQTQQRLVAVAARGGGSLGEGGFGAGGGYFGFGGGGFGLGRGDFGLDGGDFGGALATGGVRVARAAGLRRRRLLSPGSLWRLVGSRRPARVCGPGVVRARIGHRARLLAFSQPVLVTFSQLVFIT